MTSAGGSGYGVIFQLTTGGTETVLHNFGGTGGGTAFAYALSSKTLTTLHYFGLLPGDASAPHGSLMQASDGSFYGVTGGGANGLGSAFKLTASGRESVLWSFTGGSDGKIPVGNLIQGSSRGRATGQTLGCRYFWEQTRLA